jgi:transposase
MIPVPAGVKVWLATGHTDMRKGFPGLSLMVQETLKRDPMCGHLFVFRGRGGGLIKVIWHDGPWRSFGAVEFATLEWVDWFNYRRLLEPIGNIPPAEAEKQYYARLDAPAMAAYLKRNGLCQTRCGSNHSTDGFASATLNSTDSLPTMQGIRTVVSLR